MRKLLLLVATLAFGSAFAQDYVMGIVFDAGGKFDGSFNEGTWRGMVQAIEKAESDFGIEIDHIEFEGTPDTSAEGHRSIAAEGAELIIGPGFAQADGISAAASEFPDTNWVFIDGWPLGDNVRAVAFKEHEGSFLVGYIAGTLTQTGVVGFVGGMDIPLIRKFNLGYEEGVKAACEGCTIVSNYVGVTPSAWNDPARAKEIATTQRAQGADIIYAAAGASGNGVIDFVNEKMCYTPSGSPRLTPLASILDSAEFSPQYTDACGSDSEPLFFIGVDSNQNFRGDTDGNPSTLNHGLTSMLKRVDVAAGNAVRDIVAGEFTGGFEELGLADNGVGYAVDEYNEELLPQTLITSLELISALIISGELEVTDFTAQ